MRTRGDAGGRREPVARRTPMLGPCIEDSGNVGGGASGHLALRQRLDPACVFMGLGDLVQLHQVLPARGQAARPELTRL